MTQRERRLSKIIVMALVGLALTFALCRCADAPVERPRLADVPAQVTADDLSHRETAARVAAIDAQSQGHIEEANRQSAIADELAKMRVAAERRATDERAELAALTDKAEAAAQKRAEEKQRASDRRWAVGIAGVGIALAIAGAGLLMWWGITMKLAIGVPGAVVVACLVGSAWFAAGSVLLYVLGGLAVLAVLAVAALAVWVAIHLGRETQHYANAAAEPKSAERFGLDAASIARQPAVVRWLVTRLLTRHEVPA
jgi:hypothetical protein